MRELSLSRKKARLMKAYVAGYPIWCTWQVTYACNFRCTFCSYWQDEVNFSGAARAREASTEDFRLGAAKLAEIGSLVVNLAGGEPLLRRDFAEIVSILAKQHFPVVTTNGWLINEQKAHELWEAGAWGISVSLDFDDAEAHDENRGVSGAAERARRAIQVLSQARKRPYQRVNLMCVLNDRNLGEVEDLIRFAAEHNSYFMIQPYNPIKNGSDRHIPAYPASEHLLALKRRYKNFLSNPHFLENFDRFYRERGIPDCMAGRAFFNIDNLMNVQKCVEFRQEPVGNLKKLNTQEMLWLLNAENRRNHCKACWYNCRGEVEALYSPKGLLSSLPTLLQHQKFSADDFVLPPHSGLKAPVPAVELLPVLNETSAD